MDLEAFFDAYKTIINYTKDHIDRLLAKHSDSVIEIIELLMSAKDEGKTVHIIGAGRSRLAGIIFGELLKNVGLRVSYIGETLSKPVHEGDIVIAISSSGWTNTTLFAVEQSLRLGAKIVGFTASVGSKLYRLADFVLLLPGRSNPEELPYLVRQLVGKHKTPLTPMGTISEFGTLIIAIGLINAIYHLSQQSMGNTIELFKRPIERFFEESNKILNKLENDRWRVESFIRTVMNALDKDGSKIYMTGLGLCEKVSEMVAMRYQHLGLNIFSIDDWRFRNEGDMLILISGSGENPIVLQYANEAKRSKIKLIGITANESSKLVELSDISIVFSDISIREDYIKLRIGEEKPIFIPLFELIALLFLESTVAQIAEAAHISEEIMKARHANVE